MIPRNGTAEERLPGKGPFKSVHEMIDETHPRTSLTRDEGTEWGNDEGHGRERSSLTSFLKYGVGLGRR